MISYNKIMYSLLYNSVIFESVCVCGECVGGCERIRPAPLFWESFALLVRSLHKIKITEGGKSLGSRQKILKVHKKIQFL